jgi:hypothetical protein
LQAAGTAYVHGTGGFGQLGLGEDVIEEAQPTPVSLPGDQQVRTPKDVDPDAGGHGTTTCAVRRLQSAAITGAVVVLSNCERR